MLNLRLFSRLALPVRLTPLARHTRPALPSLARLTTSRYYSDSPEDLEGSTSKEPSPTYATVSRLDRHEQYVTSRLDKHDHQIEVLGGKMDDLGKEVKDLGKEVKEGFRGLDRSIHDIESKFHATLSQWLFRAATLTVGVAFVSASAFMFPEMKELVKSWIKENKARAEEHEARAERERAELKKVKVV